MYTLLEFCVLKNFHGLMEPGAVDCALSGDKQSGKQDSCPNLGAAKSCVLSVLISTNSGQVLVWFQAWSLLPSGPCTVLYCKVETSQKEFRYKCSPGCLDCILFSLEEWFILLEAAFMYGIKLYSEAVLFKTLANNCLQLVLILCGAQ